MSAVTLLALLLQATSVVLLRHRLGKTWLRRPVTVLVLASVIYQGVSPVLMSFPSIRAQDVYRIGVAQSFVDEAMLLTAVGMLAFTVAYLLMRPERARPPVADVAALARALDWRLLAFCCAPLAILTYQGRGYNNTTGLSPSTPLGTELAASFFIILVALTSFALVLRHGPRWFLPSLAGQSLILAAAGERTPVLADAIVLGILLTTAGVRPPKAQVRTAFALTVIAVLAVTGSRAGQGRALYQHAASFSTRAGSLGTGLVVLGSPTTAAPGLLAGAALRMDGVDFPAAILQANATGVPRLPATGILQSALLAVPSALWPSKLAHGSALNPAQTEINDLGLQQVNFLPSFPGLYAGFLSPPWLVAFLALLGLLAGWGERLLLRSSSAPRLVMLAGAVIGAVSYEAGLPAVLLDLRTAAVAALAVTAIAALRKPAQAVHPMAMYEKV